MAIEREEKGPTLPIESGINLGLKGHAHRATVMAEREDLGDG